MDPPFREAFFLCSFMQNVKLNGGENTTTFTTTHPPAPIVVCYPPAPCTHTTPHTSIIEFFKKSCTHNQTNNQPNVHTQKHAHRQTSTSQKLIFVIIASSFSSCHFSRNKEQCYIPLSRIRIIDLTSVDK